MDAAGGDTEGPAFVATLANEGRRFLRAAATALPITLMVLGNCASYAQLLARRADLEADDVASAFNLSIGVATLATNLLSYCPFTLSSADMTCLLYLNQVVLPIVAANLEDKAAVATKWIALHVGSALLGGLICLLGMLRAAAALSYLPYPVIAGFLAMIGAAVVHGAAEILMPEEGQTWVPLFLGTGLAAGTTLLKGLGVPANLSSVASIVVSLLGFWGWAHFTGRPVASLREEGWLCPQRAERVPPLTTLELDWREVQWEWVLPDIKAGMLALVACIARALTLTSIEAAVGTESYSVDDEMKHTGLVTMATGGVCGIAMNPAISMSSLCKEGCQGEVRTALYATLITSASFLTLWTLGVPLTNYLPKFLLGSLLMMMGFGMLVDWVWNVRKRIEWHGNLIIFGMLAFSLKTSLIEGVMLGVGLAIVLANVRFANLEVLKYHVSGVHFRSGQEYNASQRAFLAEHGSRTQIVGITGFLFEGVGICLRDYLRRLIGNLPQEEAVLVLDFFACQGINDSACAQLVKVARLCPAKGVRLVLCDLHPRDVELLRSWNIEAEGCTFARSVGDALADAEECLLREGGRPGQLCGAHSGAEAARSAVGRWLGEAAAAQLIGIATLEVVPAGAPIIGVGGGGIAIAVPGQSDVQLELGAGDQRSPSVLLRSALGAICPTEALVGLHPQGDWHACADSSVLRVASLEELRRHPAAFQALLLAGLRQQALQFDQLAAFLTVRCGGGWHGATFDLETKAGPAFHAASTLGHWRRPGCLKWCERSCPWPTWASRPLPRDGGFSSLDAAEPECYLSTTEAPDSPVSVVLNKCLRDARVWGAAAAAADVDEASGHGVQEAEEVCRHLVLHRASLCEDLASWSQARRPRKTPPPKCTLERWLAMDPGEARQAERCRPAERASERQLRASPWSSEFDCFAARASLPAGRTVSKLGSLSSEFVQMFQAGDGNPWDVG